MQHINGCFDNVVDDTVEGWAFNPQFPESAQIVSLFIDGVFVKNAVSNLYREDLLAAGIGQGHHAFKITIPNNYIDGIEHVYDLRVGHIQLEGSPKKSQLYAQLHVQQNTIILEKKAAAPAIQSPSASAPVPAPLPTPTPAPTVTAAPIPKSIMEGSFETVDGGWIKGWAWDKSLPNDAIQVTCYINGEEIAIINAELLRSDLKKNDKGNGKHGFRFAIPKHYFTGDDLLIDMRFTSTGKSLKNSPQTVAFSPNNNITGSLDAAIFPEIRGWAWDDSAPTTPLMIDLAINGEHFTTVAAQDYRSDLAKAGIGDGNKSFRVRITKLLDPAQTYSVTAKVSGTNISLSKSPRTLTFPAANAHFTTCIERIEGGAFSRMASHQGQEPHSDASSDNTTPTQLIPAQKHLQPDARQTAHHLLALRHTHQHPPTILVPIYNAYEEVLACLEALLANTTAPAELLLINDCSTDKRIATLLRKYGKHPHVTVLTNKKNLGFTKTVNRGIAHAEHDVIFLNSDTIVTPRWLENLIYAAYQSPDIATVTAISDNIGAFSVPFAGENTMPEWLPHDTLGRLLSARAECIYPDAPTGNGFCLYVKRAAIADIGMLDDVSFPRGYGEENDFCMRAVKSGWRHCVDDSTFIFHKRSASFGDEKRTLIEASSATLQHKHPEYKQLVTSFTQSTAMLHMRRNVMDALRIVDAQHEQLASFVPEGLPRILYVLHGGATGGTPQTNADLMQTMQGVYDTFVLECDTEIVTLKRYVDGIFYVLEQWRLPTKISPLDIHHADYNAVILAVLKAYAIELVHIRHLYKHTLELPRIAHTLHIPVVMSFHDFYYVCPTINLLDENGVYCAGTCTATIPNEGSDCPTPFGDAALPPLKHAWVHQWRTHVRSALSYVDACITTCEDARSIYTTTYPELKATPFHVIEHGRDFEAQENLAHTPHPQEKLRVLIPGHLTQHKGADFIAQLIDIDNKHLQQLEFHFLGNLPQRYEHLGVWHGTYKREEFQQRVREIGCHVMGIFSVWAETYCHTLSEAWACGVPVVASHYGALGNRIHTHGGGWLVDVTRPEDAYAIICNIAHDSQDHAQKTAQARIENIRTTQQMGQDYRHVYQQVFDTHKTFALQK